MNIAFRPVKGQLMRLSDPAGPGLLERVLRTEDFYVVPRGDGAYVLGATMEERGFDDTVTAGGLHDLLRDAIELVPGMTELALEEACAGLRPSTLWEAPVQAVTRPDPSITTTALPRCNCSRMTRIPSLPIPSWSMGTAFRLRMRAPK